MARLKIYIDINIKSDPAQIAHKLCGGGYEVALISLLPQSLHSPRDTTEKYPFSSIKYQLNYKDITNCNPDYLLILGFFDSSSGRKISKYISIVSKTLKAGINVEILIPITSFKNFNLNNCYNNKKELQLTQEEKKLLEMADNIEILQNTPLSTYKSNEVYSRTEVEYLIEQSQFIKYQWQEILNNKKSWISSLPLSKAPRFFNSTWLGNIFLNKVALVSLFSLCFLLSQYLEKRYYIFVPILFFIAQTIKYRFLLVSSIITTVSFLNINLTGTNPETILHILNDLLIFLIPTYAGIKINKLNLANSNLREKAKSREEKINALYNINSDLTGCYRLEDLVNKFNSEYSTLLNVTIILICQNQAKKTTLTYPKATILNEKAVKIISSFIKNKKIHNSTLTINKDKYHIKKSYLKGETSILLGAYYHNSLDQTNKRMITAALDIVEVHIKRIRLVRDNTENNIFKEKEKIRSTLFSSVTHDLKTPLTIIMGNISLLKDSPKLSKQKKGEILESLDTEAYRLYNFINNIIDRAKLDLKSVKLKIRPTDLQELILSVIEYYKKRKFIKIWLSSPHDLPEAMIDMVMLKQVVINLIENSIKNSNKKICSIKIKLNLDHINSKIQITLEDNGPGFPENLIDKLFDNYTRLNQGDNINSSTGIGLSLCNAIIELHHGKIYAENITTKSKVKGAKISISLPINSV